MMINFSLCEKNYRLSRLRREIIQIYSKIFQNIFVEFESNL